MKDKKPLHTFCGKLHDKKLIIVSEDEETIRHIRRLINKEHTFDEENYSENYADYVELCISIL